jgi:hypothetical protein
VAAILTRRSSRVRADDVARPAIRHWLSTAGCLMLVALLVGCRATQPVADAGLGSLGASHDRDWTANHALLPRAVINGDQVMLYNVRDTRYLSNDDYVVQHFDADLRLDQLQTVDFVVVPFKEAPSLAHTMLSFGFANDRHIVVSAEARMEDGESYSAIRGAFGQYELMYVVATERDVIPLRTKHRDVDVYVYESTATPAQARALFVDMLDRVNELYEQPEFYDTLTNNCTSNIVQHINRIRPGSLSLLDPRILLPGYSDQVAFEAGLIRSRGGYYATRRRANVKEASNQNLAAADFSKKIRR